MTWHSRVAAGRFQGGSALLWTALFAVVSVFRVLHHEMWRDEMNTWAIAVDSATVAEWIAPLKYGGHGLLWPLSVTAVARMVPDPLAMQGLNVALATLAVWVVLRFAPLPAWQTLLFVFGYTLGFEYTILSRHYMWGVLCLMSALALLTASRPRVLPAALCLALLAHTTVYGVILAVALAAAGGVALWRESAAGRLESGEARRAGVGAVILVASVAAAVVWLRPPPDSGFAVGWRTHLDGAGLRALAGAFWRAFIPVPGPGLHFWNTNALDAAPGLAGLGGAAIAALVTWRVSGSLPALTCWILGAGGVALFSHMKQLGFQRHYGHIFLACIAASWLLAWARSREAEPRGESPWVRRLSAAGVLLVLAIQFLAGAYASAMDLIHPFSGSEAAARWIRENRLDDRLIVADMDHVTLPVLARLDRPRVFFPRSGQRRRQLIWNDQRLEDVKEHELLAAVENEAGRPPGRVLLLTNYRLRHLPAFLKPVARFENSIVRNERYYLYGN